MTLPELNKEISLFSSGRAVLSEIIVMQGLQAFLYRAPYVTYQIQIGQNQDTKRMNIEIQTSVNVTSYSFIH